MNCKKTLFLILVLMGVTQSVDSQSIKGKSMRLHSIPLSNNKNRTSDTLRKQTVAFLSLLPYEQTDINLRSAFDAMKSLRKDSIVYITYKKAMKNPANLEEYAVVWLHRPDTSPFAKDERCEKLLKVLQSYTEKGGTLLLTQQAVHYLNWLGFERNPLKDSTKSAIDEGYGRKLGFHAFREHSIFDGLNGGAYLLRPVSDMTTRVAGFFGKELPHDGKVIAVDWDYIFLREDSKIVLEYTPGKGKVIAAGGYIDFVTPNLNRQHLDLFIANCLDYLQGNKSNAKDYFWDYSENQVIDCPPSLENFNWSGPVNATKEWKLRETELTLGHRFATENFWDVAGERMVIMGNENGGIEEIWAHPFMAIRDYEVGIRFAYRDTIFWLSDERPEIQVDPAYFSRTYQFPRAFLKEVITCDPRDPAGVVHYEYRGVYPANLVIRFKSNLRWMWPYSENVTGSICHSWSNETGAVTFRDKSGDLVVMAGGSRKARKHCHGRFDGFEWNRSDSSFHGVPTTKIQAAALLQYDLAMNDNLDVVIVATAEGYQPALKMFDQAIHGPETLLKKQFQEVKSLFDNSLSITTPDPVFNQGYRWALDAASRFFVNTPGLGKALVAGYSTTRKGWNGEHKVNGRPGYAWYFGRDSEWSGMALLDYGDFDKVKDQLEFLGKYQDLSGKIFHEVSTSGFIHYDASDATPLYVVMAGKYFRHSGDTAFLRKAWPHIRKAIDFCFSTDTDGDHLIENTNVGHGWVEGGELYGSHATLYLAGCWGAALNEAANMASFLGIAESESYRLEAAEIRKIIDRDFWNPDSQYFAYGINKDGTFRTEPTVLPAVPMYFRMADRNKARVTLRQYAGNAFTTNWGVRIVRGDSKLFKPTGYHYGSVWPLFTGWLSLAEYNNGNYLQGYSHLMNNLKVYRSWGLGFVEEVLNGAVYEPSGVCAHQCWSETMVLQPAIEGLLGLEVNATERTITLAPHLPAHWDSLMVENIRMGEQRLGFRYLRKDSLSAYDFTPIPGEKWTIGFMPAYAAGTQVLRVTLDGMDIPFTTFTERDGMVLYVKFTVDRPSRMVVETRGGIAALPAVMEPKPGYSSEGFRILENRLTGKIFSTDVQGAEGTSSLLEIWATSPPENVTGAEFIGQTGRMFRYRVDFENSREKYITKTVSVTIQ